MRFSSKILAAAILLASSFVAPVSHAEPAAPPAAAAGLKIAIIDDQKLLAESKAAKSIEAQLVKKQESYQKDFTSLEKKLHDEEASLLSSKDKMKPDEFDKKRVAFQNEVANAQKLAQQRRNDLQQAGNEGLSKLRAQITKIVTGMAEKSGYDLVLTRQNVVLGDKSMDITDEVLAELDKTLTDVPLSFGQAKSSAAPADAPAPAAAAKK